MNDLRAYEITIDNVRLVAEYLGELGTIYEYGDLYSIVYATTPGKAKHLFIKEWNEGYEKTNLEYTDPIKVRLLAKNVVDSGESSTDIKADWGRADLTVYGQKVLNRWKQEWAIVEGYQS